MNGRRAAGADRSKPATMKRRKGTRGEMCGHLSAKTRQSHRLRRDCRHTVTPQRLPERETRLPRQDVIHDASTSEAAGTSGVGCSAGLCRDTKPRSPPRRGRRYGCRNSTSLVERTEVPEHQGLQGEKSGWRLWWYASSFMPPRSPAGASHSIHHEVNNRSLCDLNQHDARELAMRRPSEST